VVDLALVAFTHVHRDSPAPRDHRLAGSLRARAAADEAFPQDEDDEAVAAATARSPGSNSPSPRRSPVTVGSPRQPGSPSFSASGTVLGSGSPPPRTGSRVEFLLRHLPELLEIVAAAGQQKAGGLPRALFGRLSVVLCMQVTDYTTPAVAFWPPSAPPVLPDEPPPSVSVELASAWLASGLRAARTALRKAMDDDMASVTGTDEGPAALSLAADSGGDAADGEAVSSSLELWGHKTTTVREHPPTRACMMRTHGHSETLQETDRVTDSWRPEWHSVVI
jgi:hypothetical protein